MGILRTIRGKCNGIVLEIMLPDEAGDTDFVDKMQEIVDEYDNREDFLEALERTAAKLGHTIEESETTH
jgi:hypothetical protein